MDLVELETLHILFAGRFVPCPRHDSHDRRRRLIFIERLIVVDLPANRIGVRKIFTRQSFIDDDRTRFFDAGRVFRAKCSPAKNRNPERAKIIRRDDIDLRRWLLPGRNFRRAGDVETAVPFVVVEWNVRTDCRCGHTGQRGDAIHQLLEERHRLFVLVVTRVRQRHAHSQNIARVEIDRLMLRPPKAFQRQARPRQKNDSQRHLRDDQSRTRPLPARAATATARSRFVQNDRKRGVFGNAPGRPNAHENPRAQRNGASKEERWQIDPRFVETRHPRGAERENRVETPDRQEHARDGADHRQEHALSQHLPHQLPAARTKRRAHRQLLAPRDRAGQLQIRDIGAGDEQNARDRGQQQVQALPVIAHSRFEEQFHVHTAGRV